MRRQERRFSAHLISALFAVVRHIDSLQAQAQDAE
jgi:hypothetical protein